MNFYLLFKLNIFQNFYIFYYKWHLVEASVPLGLISWIRFGGGGVISDNMRANQRKIIRFNHLLANMLIFHTVVYQTKGINKLRAQGVNIPDEILAGMSPYWTEHLNRFGMFQLDMGKTAEEIEYDLQKSDI